MKGGCVPQRFAYLLIEGRHCRGRQTPWIIGAWCGYIESATRPEPLGHRNGSSLDVVHAECDFFYTAIA